MNDKIGEAVRVLKRGGVVAFPTDTVWGVGAAVSSSEGVRKFYRVKRRGKDKPSQVLVSDVDMANRYGVMGKVVRELAQKYWPGALTMVVRVKGNKVPKMVRGGGGTVGLRAPDHELVQELIKGLGEGLVAASANFAGEREPSTRADVASEFEREVDFVLEGKAGRESSSTVVDVTGDSIKILRRGRVDLNI